MLTTNVDRRNIPFYQFAGVMCMKGGIYSDEKCPICGSHFIDNHINALVCPNHQKIKASRLRVKFGDVKKRFQSYDDASRFLNGVRFKTDEMTFDPRDYKRDNPLSLYLFNFISYNNIQGLKGDYPTNFLIQYPEKIKRICRPAIMVSQMHKTISTMA